MTIEEINEICRGTLMDTLGIRFTAYSEHHVEALMPVRPALFQPGGTVHGGALIALAESVGSAGSFLTVDRRSAFKASFATWCKRRSVRGASPPASASASPSSTRIRSGGWMASTAATNRNRCTLVYCTRKMFNDRPDVLKARAPLRM